ncbi:hypothetical protein ACS386_09255 [Flavobacteriaceae bacterium LMO-SS05]
MRNTILIIFGLIGINTFGQELSCNDFKNGIFKTIIEEPMRIEIQLVREGDSQIEKIVNAPQELIDMGYPTDKKNYGTIQWIDDCSYILIYDETNTELTESQKLVNNGGGLLTEFVKIEGKCFYYKSSIKNDPNGLVVEGKYCKE